MRKTLCYAPKWTSGKMDLPMYPNLTVNDVSVYLRKSEATIKRWLSEGIIPVSYTHLATYQLGSSYQKFQYRSA